MGAKILLSEDKQARLAANKIEPRPVTVGTRPEHISLDHVDGGMLEGVVEVSEMMGSSVHLHLNAYGRDCIIELSENDEWHNHKVEGQIKGTGSIKKIDDGAYISFPMPVRTIEYALGTATAFVLFVADTKTNDAYFQCVQDYFIENKKLFEKLEQSTINIRIPVSQNLTSGDAALQELARVTFVDGPGEHLKRYVSAA